MRWITAGISVFCASIAMAAPAPDIKGEGGQAAPKGQANAQQLAGQPRKVILVDHDGREHKFDLNDPAQFEDVKHRILAGHVHEIKQDVPPPVIPKYFDLGVWSIIIFLALLFVLRKFAWKPMLEGLHKREENIRGALEQAERTRREAMDLQAKLDAQLREAGGRIAAMMEEARRDAQGLKEQMVAEAKTEIQHERERLKHELETTKAQALQEIWQQAVSLAALMSTKAVRRSLTADDHKRLLDESLAELKQAGAGFGKRTLTGSGL